MKVKQKTGLLTGSICLGILWGVLFGDRLVTAKPNDSTQVQILTEDIPWSDNLDIDGIQTATILGEPGNAELYVLLNKMSQETVLPVHTHPDNRVTTVLSGVMYYGTGEFNPETATPYEAGSIIYTPANTPHYLWAKDGETVMQQSGVGPTEIDFLE